MPDEHVLTLAEERELIKRLGPEGVRALLNERMGFPTRMMRATVVDVDWLLGEASIIEAGDTTIKTNVRWIPPGKPSLGHSMWYLKFGNDGILLPETVGEQIETNGVGADVVASMDETPSVTTTSITYVALGTGPELDIWVYQNEPIWVTVQAEHGVLAVGSNGAVFSWRAIDLSSTVWTAENDLNGCETGSIEWVHGHRRTLWFPPTTGQLTLQMRYRIIGSGTAQYKNRRIQYERVRDYAI